jgi:hypothetical protein
MHSFTQPRGITIFLQSSIETLFIIEISSLHITDWFTGPPFPCACQYYCNVYE